MLTPYLNQVFHADALKHIERRHGEGSNLVEISKQPAVTREDIIHHKDIVNNADRHVVDTDKYHQEVLISGKQINGYVVVVETISTKKNELKLKTIYKKADLLVISDGDFVGLDQILPNKCAKNAKIKTAFICSMSIATREQNMPLINTGSMTATAKVSACCAN
ncbi:PBECR3 domain-containing polyvalent protein [Helicobacter vulpis]|uniref:PBECR3 domain-containing polyvalent protein n=1 Tax=Helicobacter vulpis TaxID=2316076 RepID=UPI0019699D70|nr:hypothetical protein [Helicobacter vulpis]